MGLVPILCDRCLRHPLSLIQSQLQTLRVNEHLQLMDILQCYMVRKGWLEHGQFEILSDQVWNFNLKIHLIRSKLPTNDFELTVYNLCSITYLSIGDHFQLLLRSTSPMGTQYIRL